MDIMECFECVSCDTRLACTGKLQDTLPVKRKEKEKEEWCRQNMEGEGQNDPTSGRSCHGHWESGLTRSEGVWSELFSPLTGRAVGRVAKMYKLLLSL